MLQGAAPHGLFVSNKQPKNLNPELVQLRPKGQARAVRIAAVLWVVSPL